MNSIINKYCSSEWQEYVNFHSEIRSFKKNETLFNIGDDVEGIYIVNCGKLKIVKQTQSSTRIIRLAADGDVLGHRGFGNPWKYSIAAIALEDSELMFIPTEIFNQTVKSNPEFALHMVLFFAEELRDSESLAFQSLVKNLVASSLLKNFNAFGLQEKSTELSYTLSRKDLASMAGTTYESVVRSLAELQKEGIIKLDGKSIHILSQQKLKALSV